MRQLWRRRWVAGQIIVLDRLPARLNLAREFGADHLINVDELSVKDRVEYVLDHTRGVGADLVAEFCRLAARPVRRD